MIDFHSISTPLVIKNVPHLENYFLELIKDCKKTGYLKLS